MEAICIFVEIFFYVCGNIFSYLCEYIFVFVEPFHIADEPSGALCARKNARLIANLSQISYLCIYYHCLALQKRPNWGIKHNKSQNSRANFSGERCGIVHCASPNVCLHFKKGTLWDGSPACLVGYVQIISGNYILSRPKPPQHVFKLFSHFFSQSCTVFVIIEIEPPNCLLKVFTSK